jgi:chromosome segregation ATPase
MSSYQKLCASQLSVEEAVSQRLGTGHTDFNVQIQDVLRSDTLLCTLSADGSTHGHAQQRARELVEQLYEQDFAKKLASLKAQLGRRDEEVHSLQLDKEKMREELDRFRTRLHMAEESKERLQTSNLKLANGEEGKAAELRALQQRCADAAKAMAASELDRAQLQIKADELERALRDEQGDTSTRIHELEDALEALHLELQELTSQLHTSEQVRSQQLHDMTKAEEEASTIISHLRASLAQAQDTIKEHRQAAADAETSKRTSQSQTQKLRESVSHLKAENREAESLLRRSDRDR